MAIKYQWQGRYERRTRNHVDIVRQIANATVVANDSAINLVPISVKQQVHNL